MKSCSPWARNSAPVSTVRSKLNVVLSVGFRTQRRAQRNKMAAHVRIERRQRQQARRSRHLPDRSNPLEDLPGEEVFRRYRFLPETIIFILRQLPDLSARTQRNVPLPPLLQLLVCLRYLATGCMHLLVGDSVNVSRSTAGVCIRKVSKHISRLAPRFVSFPRGEEATRQKQAFAAISGKIYVLFTTIISKNNPV